MRYCNELISAVGPDGGVMPQLASLRNEFLARRRATHALRLATQLLHLSNRFIGGPYVCARNPLVGLGYAQGFVLV